jgi:hypothetical protein
MAYSPVIQITHIFLKSIDLSFLYGYKISMRNDHLYRDPEYSWYEYIQA